MKFPSSHTLSHLYKPFPFPSPSHSQYSNQQFSMGGGDKAVVFEDHFPAMVERLGAEGFMEELCKGFRLLMDYQKQVITLESLRRNCKVFGLAEDEELLRSMLDQGDLDGDGCLDQMEFCVLMFRLSPQIMNRATDILFRDFD